MFATIEKTIYELHRNSSRPLAVFIGSGLSIPDPSSLPLVSEAITSLLNLDWVDGEEKFPITTIDTTHSKTFEIRFEHLLSIFDEWGRHNIGHLLKQFADAGPNWYHEKIAELCKQNLIKFIVTTNFDSCLEKAFENIGCDFKCIVEENDTIENSPVITNIFKIHGTVKSNNNEYQAQGLCVELESIFILDNWKSNILLNVLNNYTLVFLGYGGYDSFDINPILKKSLNPSLFWVAHIHNNSTKLSTEIIDILKAKNGTLLELDTAQFLGGKSLPQRKDRFIFDKTYNINSGYHPSNFVGRVFQSINEYSYAKTYLEKVLISSKSKYNNLDIYDLIRNFAVSLSETSNYERALIQLLGLDSLIDEELKSLNEETIESKLYLPFLEQYLLIYEELSYVYKDLGLFDKASQCMINVFNILEYVLNEKIYTKHFIRLLLNHHMHNLNFLNLDNENDWSKLIFALGDCEKSYRMSLARGNILSLINVLFKLFLIYQKAEDFGSSQASILELIYYMKKLNSNMGYIQGLTDNIAKKFSEIELENEFEKIDNYLEKVDESWFSDDEKLYNYIQGLRSVKGQSELEWPQWDAIAKIFEQSDQMKLAIEAYKIAFKHLKISNFANEIEKNDWNQVLQKKLIN